MVISHDRPQAVKGLQTDVAGQTLVQLLPKHDSVY